MKKFITLALLGAISFTNATATTNPEIVGKLQRILQRNDQMEKQAEEMFEETIEEEGTTMLKQTEQPVIPTGPQTVTSTVPLAGISTVPANTPAPELANLPAPPTLPATASQGSLVVGNEMQNIDDTIKTLPSSSDPTAINPAEATINPAAIDEAIEKYNAIVSNEITLATTSLENAQTDLTTEKAGSSANKALLVEAAQNVYDAKKEYLDSVLNQSGAVMTLFAEKQSIATQDETKLKGDKLKFAYEATKQTLKETKAVLKIDEALLAYQRLKSEDALVIAETEKRCAEAREKVSFAQAAFDKARRQLKGKVRQWAVWIVLAVFITGLFVWGCYFINKKDDLSGVEGGSHDLYERFIDDELSQ